jgi:SAM-dependent methyltransferase
MALNPETQYADDRNLRARQRLWERQEPRFDLFGWVLGLAEVAPGQQVLDLGCGNGAYLRALRQREIDAVGCDLSLGMLRAAGEHPRLVNADAARLPFDEAAFDVVLAPHMLYHVPDRTAAAHEMRRVLRAGGVAVAVTNGRGHMRTLRDLVEAAARHGSPGWEMESSSTRTFSLENGRAPLVGAFEDVTVVRAAEAATVAVDDAGMAADYIASVADHYQDEVGRPWAEVVDDVRRAVQAVIDAEGVFTVSADTGAFVCR